VLHLTDVERRILINQARILAALYPLEAQKFERAVDLLSEGFHEAYEELILDNLKRPLIKEEMNFIYQVLEMYDWLQKSFYALSFEDKVHLPESKLVFPGFCPRNEGRELAYARFLMGNLDRFAFLEIVNPLAAAHPMRDTYHSMLKRLPQQEGEILSAVQLRLVLMGENMHETPNMLPLDFQDDYERGAVA
jgi:uncharacterized protein YfbU (UPF0304 family)